MNPKPQTLPPKPKPQTPEPQPQTPNPKHQARHLRSSLCGKGEEAADAFDFCHRRPFLIPRPSIGPLTLHPKPGARSEIRKEASQKEEYESDHGDRESVREE